MIYLNELPKIKNYSGRFPNDNYYLKKSSDWDFETKYTNAYGDNKSDNNIHKHSTGDETCSKKIVRMSKSMLNILYMFLEMSSVHGLNHITATKRHPIEYFFWIKCVLLGAAGVAYLSLSTLDRYWKNPTVISMERDYKEWNTSFPAVSVCPLIKVEEDELQSYVDNNYQNSKDKANTILFLTQLMSSNYTTFSEIKDYKGIKSNEFLKIMDQIKYNFSYSVSSSHSDVYGVTDLVQSLTEVGYCFSYNSQIAIYNQPAYWESGKFSLERQSLPLVGSPLDGDMFAQLMGMSSGYTLYIHGPFETFDIASKRLSSQYKNYQTLELSGLSIYSSKETRSLSITQRKCRFIEESNLVLSPLYTYKMCRSECRMRLAHKLCGCVPHFYRPQRNYKVCDVDGMNCLGQHHDLLVKLRDPAKDYQKIPCPCLPSCDDISYVVESETSMHWFLGTLLKWGLVKYPRLRLKRDILFGFTDLLVAIGGTAGLFLGCSVLSFIEFFYFFIFRLFCIMRKKIHFNSK